MAESSRHRRLWVKTYGSIPEGKHIHHIDGNRNNNTLENLVCVSRSMHRRMHEDRWEILGLRKDAVAINLLGGDNSPTGWKHTEETKRKIGENNRYPKTLEHREKIRNTLNKPFIFDGNLFGCNADMAEFYNWSISKAKHKKRNNKDLWHYVK